MSTQSWSTANASEPDQRDSQGIAFDNVNQTVLIFGGNGNGCAGGSDCNEMYIYTN